MGRIHDALKKAEAEREQKRRAAAEASPPEEAAPPTRERPAPTDDTPETASAPTVVQRPATVESEPWSEPKPKPKRYNPAKIASVRGLPAAPPPAAPAEAGRGPKRGMAAFLAKVTPARSASAPPAFALEAAPDETLLTVHAPDDVRAEQFRSIKTNIMALKPSPTVFAVTSATAGEGTRTTTANLAVVFSEASATRTLVIDANLRTDDGRNHFGVAADLPGLAEALSGERRPEEVVVETPVDNVYYVPAGQAPRNPGGLLASPRMQECLSAWRSHFDRVILGTPPMDAVSDAVTLGLTVDGVIVVVRMGVTPRRLTEKAVERLVGAGARVLGCVLTGSEVPPGAGAPR